MKSLLPSPLHALARAFAWMAIAALSVMAVATSAAAQNVPVLRERIVVHSNLVTLGDIFDHAGQAASAPVFRSPDLGTQGVVAAKRIATAASKHGLLWSNPGNVRQVSVERPGRVVSLDEIRTAIARHAARDFDGVTDRNLTVTLERRARSFTIEARINGALSVKRLHLQRNNGIFDATIGFENAGRQVRDRSFRGRIVETMKVVVPARAIERGATITESDLKTMRIPVSRLPAGMVDEMADLAGMAAKRRLRADQPVRRSEIERPKLVRRNALVTIIYEIPGLSLKAQGRAQGDAAQGQAVTVLNTRSNRTIQATVQGPGVVVVGTLANPVTRLSAAPSSRTSRRAELIGPQVVR